MPPSKPCAICIPGIGTLSEHSDCSCGRTASQTPIITQGFGFPFVRGGKKIIIVMNGKGNNMLEPEGSSVVSSVTLSDMLPLAEVIKRAQARDHAAFTRLYELYKQPLWNRLFHLIGDKESAYDLFQTTFLRVWKDLPQESSEVNFEAWLYTIAKNLAIDHLRHTKKLQFCTLPECEPSDSRGYAVFRQLSSVGHEESICERLCIQQALEQMSPQYRICVLLQDVWGYSQREIAESLATSEKTVSANVSRGRTQLRLAYQRLSSDVQVQKKGGPVQ